MKKLLLLIIVIVLAGGIVYKFYGVPNSKSNVMEEIVIPESDVSADSTLTEKPATSVFTHPQDLYTLEFPLDWSMESRKYGDYETFTVRTPDYKISSGFPVMEAGAEIMVSVRKEDTYKDIDASFEGNTLGKQIARNITHINVNGINALKYEYSYEGVNATMVSFIDNGFQYDVRFRYFDDAAKQYYDSNFSALLESFELIK